MKVKIFFLLLICMLFGILINKHNDLIKIPKEERQLIKVSEKSKTGNVSKIDDGDSFVLDNGAKIRLYGIDAPELNQTCTLILESQNKDTTNKDSINKDTTNKDNTNKEVIPVKEPEIINCGENAKNKLTDLIEINQVFCIIKGKDAYERLVAECSIEKYNKKTRRKDRININKEMVLSGNAIAFLQISDKYLEDENRAKSENKGIWATTFDSPSVYRKKHNKD